MTGKSSRLDRRQRPELRIGRNELPVFFFNSLRPQLLKTLQPETKCLVVVAPVGYGKTVMMSMLFNDLRQAGKQCLWLTLDDRDLTVESIIFELGEMLYRDDKSLHPTQALFRGYDLAERRIDILIRQLNNYPLPITIFIDNLHFCVDPGLGRLLDQFLFRTRGSVHFVISSSREIPFDTTRAQLEGLTRQIGPAELSFGECEVAELLGDKLCQKIGAQGIREVVRKTEGWPAAARMIKILLDSSAQPKAALESFSGSDESFGQLLNSQVLSAFSDETREFLLGLAQLRIFSEELCSEAIGGKQAVHEHLTYLAEHNMFIIPLDPSRSWFRLHGLFRDHLLRESELLLDASRRQEVLVRAARWCERHGLWRDAVEYAFTSGSMPTAIQILEHIAPFFVRDLGAGTQYIRWLEMLHERGRQAGAEAEYWFVWALAFHRRYEYAHKQITKLSSRLQRRKSRAGSSDLHRRIAILRISLDSLMDRIEDSYQGAARWLAEANDGEDDAFDLAAAHCIICCYLTNNFRFVEARKVAQFARQIAFQAESTYAQGWVACYAALIAVGEGGYADAYADLVQALAVTRAELGDEAGICGTMALIAARSAVGMGLDSEARQLLELGIKSSRDHGFLEAAGCGLEAGLMLWSGKDDDVIELSMLRNVVGVYPQRLAYTFSCYLIRRLIVLGRIDDAFAEAERIGLNHASGKGTGRTEKALRVAHLDALMAMAKIELQIAAGRYKRVMPLLAGELRQAKASGCSARLVELELNSASIAVRLQDHALGIRHVTRAVRIASSRRIVRPFTDHLEILNILVSQSKASAWGFAIEEERLFFVQICRHLDSAGQVEIANLAASEGGSRMLDVLTPREIELLGFLDAGLSNQQMADRTDISLTTVKWHLQNLYGKLGVSSRTAALARARTMSLLG
ncbi:LuxR C-terminal-related transcriptional regulator [Pseudomonas borbori]|uniref:LuxR family transcriptional regulator, maltose regulon positive regulatory protein n=1 Tax=Pseudomonas borbori TaxID=289003 RepID=A0A1I5WPJ9_9PSED|nr:LuxR C-terminal-related transcriptional regulator [Pseudomonas borbori]SFQ21507.1 LuxR family transcriptional regulator, maltose regulon positive regulatory protein [Pseudomonas borbori]